MPCGRIDIQGKTMVPDERRGKLRLCKDTDGLTHLQWGVRAPDMPFTPEEDLLVFPREAEMKFIPKPGVFVIKFPDDPSRNAFFWSQRQTSDAEPQSDEALTADVNAALNGESPAFATRRSDPAARARAVRAAQAAAASALSGPEETPAATAGVASTPAAPAKAEKQPVTDEPMEDEPTETETEKAADGNAFTKKKKSAAVSGDALRAALGGIGAAGAVPGGGAPAADPAAMARMLAGMRPRGPGLNEVLTPEAVGPLLRDENVRARLAEFLPDAHRGSENLEALMRTPQFQSQLERFSAALQSGQMDLAQFGLRGGTGFSVAEFLAAIQAKADEARDERDAPGKDEEN